MFFIHFKCDQETSVFTSFSGSFWSRAGCKILNMASLYVIWLLVHIADSTTRLFCLSFLQLQRYFFSSAGTPCALFPLGILSLLLLLFTFSPPTLFLLVNPYPFFQFLFTVSRNPSWDFSWVVLLLCAPWAHYISFMIVLKMLKFNCVFTYIPHYLIKA